jgi:hypothetical protein
MYRYCKSDTLETVLQLVDDPTERAALIEKAYQLLRTSETPRNEPRTQLAR